jgi:hypothetical protein
VNGDGHPDLLVTYSCANLTDCSSGGVDVLLGNGNGTFKSPVTYTSGGQHAAAVSVTDVNGDGHLDLVVGNSCQSNGVCLNGAVGVLLGNGDGTFRSPVSYISNGWGYESIAVGDVNADGRPDIIVVNQYACQNCILGGVSVMLGEGDGTFQSPVSYGSGGLSRSVAIGDVNGDGRPDLVVANQCHGQGGRCGRFLADGKAAVLLGNGDGTFQSPALYGAGGKATVVVTIADVNGDNRPDLLTGNVFNGQSSDGSVGVLLNDLTATTNTKISSSLNPSKVNQAVTFTATVSSSSLVPDGSVVTFYNGATKIGTGTTTNGVATMTTSFPQAGKYTIKVAYPGDAFHPASSGKVTQVVNQ